MDDRLNEIDEMIANIDAYFATEEAQQIARYEAKVNEICDEASKSKFRLLGYPDSVEDIAETAEHTFYKFDAYVQVTLLEPIEKRLASIESRLAALEEKISNAAPCC